MAYFGSLGDIDIGSINAQLDVNAVDVFIYDTSKDSDGGAWRKRTQGTSWYNETLNTATRGSRREFPSVAVIVAENNKVTIYDGDDPSLPMWMVFNGSFSNAMHQLGSDITIAMLNGQLIIGSPIYDLSRIDFVGDRAANSFNYREYKGNISTRNNLLEWIDYQATWYANANLVSRAVNDVAMTVLPNAPIDPATGLPIPTIAVATAGGVSVIKDDGSVVDFYTSHNDYNHSFNVNFSDNGLWFDISVSSNLAGWTYFYKEIPENDTLVSVGAKGTADSFYNGNAFATKDLYLLGTTNKIIENNNIGTTSGVAKVHQKLEIPENGMVNHLNSSYNTGWMLGDIKGAFLADTDDTDIVGSGELVDNGGFDTDGGWILGTGWSITGGVAKATGVTSDAKYMEQNIGLVAGKLYRYEFTTSGNLTGTNYFALRFGGVSDDLSVSQAKTYSGTIVASGSGNLRIRSEASTNDITIDNISVQLADADRSVNNKGLIVSSTEYEPDLDLLFTTENYTVNNQVSDFESALTHTRDSNATMVDSDGLIKWAPHNELTYSEDFEPATTDWIQSGVTATSNAATAPDGSVTAGSVIVNSGAQSSVQLYSDFGVGVASTKFTVRAYVKSNGAQYVYIGWIYSNGVYCAASFDLSSGTLSRSGAAGGFSIVGTPSIDPVVGSTGWYLISITATTPSSAGFSRFPAVCPRIDEWTTGNPDSNGGTGNGTDGILVWGAHVYRSDLGGMVNNPDTGDSYVPTTSSARYLPRRGHHTWDGSNWVNSGLLLESEARTNLVTYSENFTAWIKPDATVGSTTVSPTGASDAYSIVEASGYNSQIIYRNFSGVSQCVLSCFAKAGARTIFRIGCNADNVNWAAASYDLSSGLKYSAQSAGDFTATSDIQDFGDGWYRCFLYVSSSNALISQMKIGPSDVINPTFGGFGDYFYSGNGSSDIKVFGAQVEAGSTPSSYIPTPGSNPDSTATRTAETLTVPAANMPWPTPNVIGPELVDNGGFIGDSTTGWTLGTGWSVASEQLSHVAGVATLSSYNISLTLGKVYIATCDVIAISGGSGSLQFRNGGTTTGVTITGADIGNTVSIIYTAEGNNLIAVFSGAGTNITVDNISVREIDPLSVSLQMEGKMTYADTNQDLEARFFNWEVNVDNRIDVRLNTIGSVTGRPVFRSKANGVTNEVATASITYFSPGVLTPYNIASRHGSTFINGAVDGTALTEDTTPTALPDLSTTDLQFSSDYMGTISRFRVWDEDIADTGIEKATSYQPLIKSVGTITRTPVATGAELVTYSGFSATDYLYQPYNSNLDFGTGDFCVMFWMRHFTNSLGSLVSFLGNPGDGTTGWALSSSYGNVRFSLYDGSSTRSALTPSDVAIDEMKHICCVRIGDIVYIYVNGEFVISNSGFSSYDVSTTNGILKIGDSSTSAFLALLRITATVPTEQQILKIYNDEKVLFEENAKCTLYGSSDAVTALAYDDSTNLLHVGTSAGRSVFSGLERIENTTTPITTAISAVNGMIAEQ